jgi:hypothetical protein
VNKATVAIAHVRSKSEPWAREGMRRRRRAHEIALTRLAVD